MRQRRPFWVYLSVLAIRRIWHGRIGRLHNEKRHIVCPFIPSCSHYAILALEKYGFLTGWFMTGKRLWRCHKKPVPGTLDYP
jgi:putative component of membrane protein insertase Oxa1/YidC/SpoIIIJ protein YidD